MNRDDIIRMAREAGFTEDLAEFLGLKKFSRFATLVAVAEREACAKLCDELDAKNWSDCGEYASGYSENIRARGNT